MGRIIRTGFGFIRTSLQMSLLTHYVVSQTEQRNLREDFSETVYSENTEEKQSKKCRNERLFFDFCEKNRDRLQNFSAQSFNHVKSHAVHCMAHS
jgi:hypothetical protein